MPDFISKLRLRPGDGRVARPLVVPLVLALLLLNACSPFKLLRPGQRLLSRIEVKGVATADKERLLALTQQKPNSRFPLPKLAIYQLGFRFYDSLRIKNKLKNLQTGFDARLQAAGTDSARIGKLLTRRERLVKRKQMALDKGNAIMRLGEAPAIYDSTRTRRSVEQMTTYLHAHGLFRARVVATDTARYERGIVLKVLTIVGRVLPGKPDSLDAAKHYRRVTVTYAVSRTQPFLYRLQVPSIPDSGVAAVVRAGQGTSFLHENDRYNEDLIGQERTRLEALLKNNGYFDFRQQYITLEADTSFAPFTVRLRTFITNPAPGQGHRVYSLREVRFVTDAGVNRTLRAATGDTLRRAGTTRDVAVRPNLGVRTDTVTTDSIRFAAYEQRFTTRLLARKVLIRPGQRYSLDRTQRTQRLLADLDMFRFQTVNYRKVPDRPSTDSASTHPSTGQLMAVVNASPAPKYQETTELGGTYVANLVGPFMNVRLKSRNPFGGAEVLEFGLRAGLEGQLTSVPDPLDTTKTKSEPVYTVQLGATASLVLPQFLVPFRTNRFLTRYNPKTRFTLSTTYVNRPEYTRSNVEFAYDYVWQRSAFHQYVFSPVVITLVNTPFQSDSFTVRLKRLQVQKGSSLYRSFNKQIEPSFSLTSLYNSNDFNQTRDACYFRVSAELGGLTRSFYRTRLYEATSLAVYDFARLSLDYRRYHHLTPRTFFVWRLNGGAVHALTRDTYTDAFIVPYDKSFFAGGSTSLRAWQARRLGPGGYTPELGNNNGKRDFISEQPGELLLEGSAEYRFPLVSFLKGAVFTDFGNVWGLQEPRYEAGTVIDHKDVGGEYKRPGAQFELNSFYKQIALDAGVGFRFDFTFLILRLDVATKIYDPNALESRRWALRGFDGSSRYLSLNIGIGYPF